MTPLKIAKKKKERVKNLYLKGVPPAKIAILIPGTIFSVYRWLREMGIKCPGRKLDLSNQKFTSLTVIKQAATKRFGQREFTRWKCKCACGKMTIVNTRNLRAGTTRSCGCRIGTVLPGDELAFNRLYSHYRNSSRIDNRIFNLTKKDFRALTSSSCYYCGTLPSQIIKPNVKHLYALPYIYNGIDRINTNNGYEINNCCSCCKNCNRAKSNMPEKEFWKWIKRIVFHNKDTFT